MDPKQFSHHYHDTRVSDRALLGQGNVYFDVVLLVVQEERARYRSLHRQVRRRHKRKIPRAMRYETHDVIEIEAEEQAKTRL